MASSSRSRVEGKPQVFFSFRATDVRYNFVDYLDTALSSAGIRTFNESVDVRPGDVIVTAIKKAIQDARIAVIIFSENYASFRWCLKELAEIMECKKQGSLVVCPVFYRVRPREVRLQRGGFGEALAEHEVTLGKDSNKLKRWRDALSEAASLFGWTLDADGDEAGLVTSIIKKIGVMLDRTHLYVTEHPIGIEA